MANLSYGSTIGASLGNAIGKSNLNLAKNAEAVGTGIKPLDDVVAYILGASLKDSKIVYEAVATGVNYAVNLLKSAASSLGQIESVLQEAKSIIAQAASPNDLSVQTLNDTFQALMTKLARITNKSEFDSRKLLNGTLGGQAKIVNAFGTYDSTQRVTGTLPAQFDAGGVVAGEGAAATSTFTVGGASADGDTISIAGITFTFRTALTAGVANEILIGTTTAQNAQNIAEAIANSKSKETKSLHVSVAGSVVTATYVAKGPITTATTSSSGSVVRVDNNGATGAVTIGNMSKASAFIGKVLPNFASLGVGTYANAGDISAFAATNGILTANVSGFVEANAGDQMAAFTCNIGGVEYRGGIGVAAANAGAIQAPQYLKMVARDGSGSNFSINFTVDAANNISTLGNTQGIATNINNLFTNNLSFAQNHFVQLDNTHGDIKLNDGTLIGSTKGVVATLTASDFKDLKIEDFKIEEDAANAGKVMFTTVINNRKFTINNVDPATLLKGTLITMSAPADAMGKVDTFTLNVGDVALSLGTAASRDEVQSSFKKMLGAGEPLKIRVGEDTDDIVEVELDDMSSTRILLDNAGAVATDIDITDNAKRNRADEVITNALKTVRSNLAGIVGQIKDLQDSAFSIKDTIGVLEQARSSYADAEIDKSAEAFKDELIKIQGAIAMLVQYNRLKQAILRIIEG